MEHKLAFTVAYDRAISQPLTEVVFLGEDNKVLHKGFALWDTGATCSCVTNNIAKEINLPIVGKARNTGVNNISEECNVYLALVGLPNKVSIGTHLMGIADRDDFCMLIGMDIIAQGEFAITTFGGKSVMTFCTPARKHIDFVAEINAGPKILISQKSLCHCGSRKKFKHCHGKQTSH